LPSVRLHSASNVNRDLRMPVTAKLSRAFYDRFGDDVANELVGLLNVMDSTYLTELRALNATNFALFDAKVEQRFAESEARLDKRFAEQDTKWERRFADQDTKWERRFAELDVKFAQRFADVDRRFVEADARMEKRFAEQDVKMAAGFAQQHQSLLRWMLTLALGLIVGFSSLFVQLTQR
jgi:CRP-like cAMP-binding protein